MSEANTTPMSWPVIIAIMVGTSVVVGMTLGFFGDMLGIDGGARTAGAGAAVGVVGAILIVRRNAQLRGS